MRSEEQIFEEVRDLCTTTGYIHTLAAMCIFESFIPYTDEVRVDNLAHLYTEDRLVRTETTLLLRLLATRSLNFEAVGAGDLKSQTERSKELLGDLHKSLMSHWGTPADLLKEKRTPFDQGDSWREPFFYGGESAYPFQFISLAVKKYASDNAWLLEQKGFSIEDAALIVEAILRIREDNGTEVITKISKGNQTASALQGMTFSVQALVKLTDLEEGTVRSFLLAFAFEAGSALPPFNSILDFNCVNATPILKLSDNDFALFDIFSLTAALYETPNFWLLSDTSYAATLKKNRGSFTENFAIERLRNVFGKANVFSNLDIYKRKGTKSRSNRLGEIDVLVTFGDRAILVQAKSKRLTLQAIGGNEKQIKDDFQKSVQSSYDQGKSCAELLNATDFIFVDTEGNEVSLKTGFKKIYLVCLLADHYPALSSQARMFLNYKVTNEVPAPYVIDVFTLDVLTEMLDTPLHFLSYIERRSQYDDMVVASHEITVLGYHLKTNLWIEDKQSMIMLHDDTASGLDIAMMARRRGLPGSTIPEGILPGYSKGAIGSILREIEHRADSETLELGFELLRLSGETVDNLNAGIFRIRKMTNADGELHDLSAAWADSVGITIHCSIRPAPVAMAALASHCSKRKYKEKSPKWFGLCIDREGHIRFGANLYYPWIFDAEMEKSVEKMQSAQSMKTLRTQFAKPKGPGRNEPCPCGSGKKSKKCCYS